MNLTPSQERQLKATLKFRDRPPTVWWFVRASWRVYAYFAIFGAIGIPLSQWAGLPLLSAFIVGVIFSAVVRDLKFFRQFVKGWPLSNEITNWDRVNELLNQAALLRPNNSLERTREG